MADTTFVLRAPSRGYSAINTVLSPAALAGRAAKFLRSRWIYISTVSKLEGYSERNLQDMGAAYGIEEFARRAAGL